MKKLLIFGLAVIVLLIGGAYLIGLAQPVGHVASGSAVFDQAPEALWARMTDFQSWTTWNSAFTGVRREPDQNGQPVWTFVGDWGEMPFRVEVSEPPRRMVTRIVESADLGFAGSWTYEIAPHERGCVLTITERGELDSAIFRFFMWLRGPHETLEQFLVDLGKDLGQQVEVRLE